MICKVCQEDKPLDAYRTYKKVSGIGYESACKACVLRSNAARTRQRKATDPAFAESIRQAAQRYREAHREAINQSKREHRAKSGKPQAGQLPQQKALTPEEARTRRLRQKKESYQRMMADPVKASAERERKRQRRRKTPRHHVSGLKSRLCCLSWQVVRHQIKKRKREIRKLENIKNDPKRLATHKLKSLERQRRRTEAVRSDPVRYEAYLQKQQQLMAAIAQLAQVTKKKARKKKTSRANISAWLGSISDK
jgi:hypothetical protein